MKHPVRIALAIALLLALPSMAAAADFSLFAAALDTDDLDESFGLGLRVAFDINEQFDFDISASYFEDFENRFEDVEDESEIQVGFIPVDLGITWSSQPEGGFTAGGGVTYAFMDLANLEINDMSVRDPGDADDEFGFYAKVGYQAPAGFFGEVMYRDLDVSIEDLAPFLQALGLTRIELDMSGFQINLGWRF